MATVIVSVTPTPPVPAAAAATVTCSLTDGVDTNGAAAKLLNFVRYRLGKRARRTPWHFREDKKQADWSAQKVPLSRNIKRIRSDPVSADPIFPFPVLVISLLSLLQIVYFCSDPISANPICPFPKTSPHPEDRHISTNDLSALKKTCIRRVALDERLPPSSTVPPKVGICSDPISADPICPSLFSSRGKHKQTDTRADSHRTDKKKRKHLTPFVPFRGPP